MKVDLHVHSKYSGHSILSIPNIKKIAIKRGLEGVAITDHNEIKGALELSKMFPTIIGEEISTTDGEIIGLYLNEKIPRGSAIETMDRIRAQGGLVVAPHPFDSLRKESLMSEKLCSMCDIIEVFNSRVIRAKDNLRSFEFAKLKGYPIVVGSDAHTSIEIGNSWMDIDIIDDPKSFMRSLSNVKCTVQRSPVIVHVQSKLLKMREAIR